MDEGDPVNSLILMHIDYGLGLNFNLIFFFGPNLFAIFTKFTSKVTNNLMSN
jgi:hypothetical protein